MNDPNKQIIGYWLDIFKKKNGFNENLHFYLFCLRECFPENILELDKKKDQIPFPFTEST
jgi:hypothetical protein